MAEPWQRKFEEADPALVEPWQYVFATAPTGQPWQEISTAVFEPEPWQRMALVASGEDYQRRWEQP